jgi:hypothetical protein
MIKTYSLPENNTGFDILSVGTYQNIACDDLIIRSFVGGLAEVIISRMFVAVNTRSKKSIQWRLECKDDTTGEKLLVNLK